MGKLKSMFGSKPAEPEKIFTDNYFVEKAKAMEALGAKIITLKDMAGLVNPSRAASIISALKANVKVPVDFHTHCTPGYGLASALMAIINGVDILDTNIWWFGGGSAAPAIELIYIFCQRLGVEVEVNMEAVGRIRKELFNARKALADFDLNRDKMPIDFDPLNDTLPLPKSQPCSTQLSVLHLPVMKKACLRHAIRSRHISISPNPTNLSRQRKCPEACTPIW